MQRKCIIIYWSVCFVWVCADFILWTRNGSKRENFVPLVVLQAYGLHPCRNLQLHHSSTSGLFGPTKQLLELSNFYLSVFSAYPPHRSACTAIRMNTEMDKELTTRKFAIGTLINSYNMKKILHNI